MIHDIGCHHVAGNDRLWGGHQGTGRHAESALHHGTHTGLHRHVLISVDC